MRIQPTQKHWKSRTDSLALGDRIARVEQMIVTSRALRPDPREGEPCGHEAIGASAIIEVRGPDHGARVGKGMHRDTRRFVPTASSEAARLHVCPRLVALREQGREDRRSGGPPPPRSVICRRAGDHRLAPERTAPIAPGGRSRRYPGTCSTRLANSGLRGRLRAERETACQLKARS